MEAKKIAREREKSQLLARLAELHTEEMAEAGELDESTHFGQIERAAHALGRQLGREAVERASREVAAECDVQVACPDCGVLCDVEPQRRTIEGMDGPTEITEPVADCRRCRRSFFPSADSEGAR